MANLLIFHCPYTGQGDHRVLKTQLSTRLNDKRFRCTRWVSGICQEQKISELRLKLRGFSERGSSTKVVLNFHLQQQIYTKRACVKYAPVHNTS